MKARRLLDLLPVRIISDTVVSCMRHRALGLGAESAFFMLLSLPPLLFGLVGSIGYVATTISGLPTNELRAQILELANNSISEDVVRSVIAPMLDEVLIGRIDVVSIGFLLSLWAGSRAVAVFLDTVSIMYGKGGERGIVQTRALSIGIYVAFLTTAAVLLPLILTGPRLLRELLGPHWEFLVTAYWPVVGIGSMYTIKIMYSKSTLAKHKWWADLPGSALALSIWLLGSWWLRISLSSAIGGSTIYGPLATPIALLLWMYIVSVALLIGAAFNAAIAQHLPSFRPKAAPQKELS